MANMEIYDIYEYIKRKVFFKAILKITTFKGIFKYETHIHI